MIKNPDTQINNHLFRNKVSYLYSYLILCAAVINLFSPFQAA
jgi:hypothetical protein